MNQPRQSRHPRRRSLLAHGARWGAWLLAALLVAFLVLPLLGLGVTLGDFSAGLAHPLAWAALELSLVTTGLSLLVIVCCGTPLAWWLARHDGRLARALEMIVQLPIVVPPAVAGVALLLAFGRQGLLGGLYPEGEGIAFTTAAVVLAQVFVAAPFYVQGATAAFRRLDGDVLLVAQSLGASPARVFFRIAAPMAAPGLVAGAALSWARALGEFGATLMFAGNQPGRSQTLPLAIYEALETDLQAAQALAVLLVLVAFLLLLAVRAATHRATVS